MKLVPTELLLSTFIVKLLLSTIIVLTDFCIYYLFHIKQLVFIDYETFIIYLRAGMLVGKCVFAEEEPGASGQWSYQR